MSNVLLDVSDLWGSLSGDNMSVLFATFVDESKALTEKWNKGHEHVTLQEKRAVGNFLSEIGAVFLQVEEEKKKQSSQLKAEVHCIRIHREQASLVSWQEKEEDGIKEEIVSGLSAQDERVLTDARSSPPNVGATDELASIAEHESESYSPSLSRGDEDVSGDDDDDDDDWGCRGDNVRHDVLLDEVSQIKESEVTVSPSKSSLDVSNVEVQSEEANDDDHAVSSGDHQLEREGMGGTISTIESSQVQDESTTEMEASGTPHKCSLCLSSFPSMWQLDLHVFKCKFVLYYDCPLCKKPYCTKTGLSDHLYWVHNMTATEIIERLSNLAGHPREKQNKKIHWHGDASSKKLRKKTAKKRDKKDPEYAKNVSKARKQKKGNRIDADDLRRHDDEKIKLFQCSGGIVMRSSTRRKSGSQDDVASSQQEEKERRAKSRKEKKSKESPVQEGSQYKSSTKRKSGSQEDVASSKQEDVASSKQEEKERRAKRRKEKKSKEKSCNFCGKTLGSKFALQCHLKADHLGDKFECRTCGEKFVVMARFKTHLEQHGDPEGAPYKCDICYASFKTKSTLINHKDVTHLKRSDFTCKVCHAVLTTKGALKRHNNIHTKEKSYPCEQCYRVFYEKSRLKEHMLMHSGVKRVKCDQCDASFYQQIQLKVHKRNVHVPSNTYLCDVCGARYKSKINLKQHHQTAHTDISFPCDVCGKRFNRKSNLYSHMKVHLDVRPHKCQLCEKSFRIRRDLNVHMDWHNGVRNHKCSMCDMSFLTKGNLDKHMQKHQKTLTHTCKECRHSFSGLTSLRRHLDRVHNFVLESKVTKAPTRLSRTPASAKTTERPDSTGDIPTSDAHADGVPSVPSGVDGAPDSQVQPLEVSINMDLMADIGCVEERIPAVIIKQEGQATDALLQMMPSSQGT